MSSSLNTSSDTCDNFGLPHCTINKGYAAPVILITSFIVLANLFNILVIGKTKTLHDNAGWFMLSLSIADLMVGIVSMASNGRILLDKWPSTIAENNFIGFLVTTNVSISITTLAAMSLDRYLALRLALRYHELLTTKRILLIIVLLWTSNISIMAMGVFGVGGIAYDKQAYASFIDAVESRWFFVVFVLLIFGPAVAITLSSYVSIWRIAAKHSREIALHHQQQPGMASTNSPAILRISKAARTIFVTVVIFLICWTPYFLLQLIAALLGRKIGLPDFWAFLFPWIGASNSCMNAFIYNITNRQFREGSARLLPQFLACIGYRKNRVASINFKSKRGEASLSM